MRDETIDDRVHYQSGDFCRDVGCTVIHDLERADKESPIHGMYMNKCRRECGHSREEFMLWLRNNGYRLEGAGRAGEICPDGTAYEFHDFLTRNGIDIVKDPSGRS